MGKQRIKKVKAVKNCLGCCFLTEEHRCAKLMMEDVGDKMMMEKVRKNYFSQHYELVNSDSTDCLDSHDGAFIFKIC